jgi:hypothetical protein
MSEEQPSTSKPQPGPSTEPQPNSGTIPSTQPQSGPALTDAGGLVHAEKAVKPEQTRNQDEAGQATQKRIGH